MPQPIPYVSSPHVDCLGKGATFKVLSAGPGELRGLRTQCDLSQSSTQASGSRATMRLSNDAVALPIYAPGSADLVDEDVQDHCWCLSIRAIAYLHVQGCCEAKGVGKAMFRGLQNVNVHNNVFPCDNSACNCDIGTCELLCTTQWWSCQYCGRASGRIALDRATLRGS